MTVYVDKLMSWGWKIRGRMVESCHMFTDSLDLSELHAMAEKIGMRREWFQDHTDHPHYDLTAAKRALAVRNGAQEADMRKTINILRSRRSAFADTQ